MRPAVYAHVATEPGYPGRLALQYWIFYAYNDWNNLHEGDWENVQLVFDAATAAEALTRKPVSIGYSQHEGAERADWGDAKLELVDGRHPVVYPAAGSHANFFDTLAATSAARRARASAAMTRAGPHVELHPTVFTIPSDPAAGAARVPVDRVPGALGRAPGGVLQRPDRAEPEELVDRADPLVRDVEGSELRGAGRRACSGRARPTSSAPQSEPAPSA